jgi:hypothetical protein
MNQSGFYLSPAVDPRLIGGRLLSPSLRDPQFIPRRQVDRQSQLYYYGAEYQALGTNGTITQSTLYASFFEVGQPQVFDAIGVVVATGVASATMRLGVYADDGNGRPGQLLIDGGTCDCSGNGTKFVRIPLTLLGGNVWLAGVSQGAASNVARVPFYSGLRYGQANPFSVGCLGWSQTGVTGALPNPWGFTYTAVTAAAILPVMLLRKY